MIVFKKIRYKNFLSTGNAFTEINLNKHNTTLTVGTNGSGKCLRGSTEIDISIDDEQVKITIKDLYDFLGKNPQKLNHISVFTKHGLKKIEAIGYTAFNSKILKLQTENGKSIETSPDHLLWNPDKNDWVKSKDLSEGMLLETEHGYEEIKTIEELSFVEDLMDIQVEDVHEFWANGIRSHNSTFIDSISFNLFGKPFRDIRKPQLINSINQKDCLTELEFTIGKTEYLVRRGIKPNIFEIFVNGVLINQDAQAKDYQDYLEKHILKFNYKTFKQVIALSSSSFVPFMQLKTRDRREIIEDLLELSIFSTMNNLLKARVSEMKQQLKDYEYDYKLLMVELQNEEKILKQNTQNKEDQIKQLKEELEQIKDSAKNRKKEIEKLTKKLEQKEHLLSEKNNITTDLNNFKSQILSNQNHIKTLQENIDFFDENEICPVCTQKIDEHHKHNIIHKDTEKKEAHKKEISSLKKKMVDINDQYVYINKQLNEMDKISVQMSEMMGQMRSSVTYSKKLLSKIEKLDTIDDNVETKTNVETLKNRIKKLEKTIEKAKNIQSIQTLGLDVLKDTGIKSRIINQYVPMFNKLVNKYLSDMDFFVQFELDENFNETIRSRNRDTFSYASFSEGEKMRIDFALLLTWRTVARLKNSVKTNLLILDEIFDSSLDTQGVDDVMKLLNSLDGNVFLISHKGEILTDKFENTITFHKPNNFSVIAEEN